MESTSAESKNKIMGEPPVTFDDLSEPPDYIDTKACAGRDLDPEIESHVEAVERRDADRSSEPVERTHRGPRQTRRRPGVRRSRHGQPLASGRRCPRRDEDDEQDEQQQRNSRSLRAGLVLTIALTAISVVAFLVMFAANSGALTAPPDIEITPRQSTADPYLTVRPPAPAPPLPTVKQIPLRLPKRSSN